MSTTLAGRPIIKGVLKPLTQDSPMSWWDEEAESHGCTGAELREQVALADKIIEEILLEEAVSYESTKVR